MIDGHQFPNRFVDLVRGVVGWQVGAVGDVNGDSRLDFVISDGGDTIEVYMATAVPSFVNRFFIDAGGPIRSGSQSISVADFDGDAIGDIAFVREGEPDDELMVAFGSSTGTFSEPIFMGGQGEILGIISGLISNPAGVRDLVFDLLVLSADSTAEVQTGDDEDGTGEEGEIQTRAASIFAGDSSRRMLSPLVLVPPADSVINVVKTDKSKILCRDHIPVSYTHLTLPTKA